MTQSRIGMAALVVVGLGLVVALGLGFGRTMSRSDAAWAGVDEVVVEAMAREAGRTPREPFFAPQHGDLPLLFALLAGALGGFAGGYCFRGLFPPRVAEVGRAAKKEP